MRLQRIPLVVLAVVALFASTISTTATSTVAVQGQQASALERGYRTGYSDGYNAGYRDTADGAERNYQTKEEYQRADRNFNHAWGTIEDYRDGYQQGFEAGYSAGFDRQIFNSTIPAGLTRRGVVDSTTVTTDTTQTTNTNTASSVPVGAPIVIRQDEILLVELLSPLSTDASQRGDRFQARVLQPRELEGAIVEGRVTRVKRPGKVKSSAEMQLDFQSIRLSESDNRSIGFSGDVVEIVDMSGRDNDGPTVDDEGGVKSKDTTKDDVVKVGATTGIGAIIGAIAGGGKGAAIGAAIGGGIGTAGVLSSRGKDLRLDRGQQLRIRSATETRIQ